MNGQLEKSNVTSDFKEIVAIPHKVLQDVLRRKISGRLTIQDPNDLSVQWRLYLGNGKLHFAGSLNGRRERLAYLLSQYFPEHNLYIPQELECDYKYICEHWRNGQIDLNQTRQILTSITQEALLLCLALPRASLKFEKIVGLDPLILSLDIKSLIVPVKEDVRQWLRLRTEISSPFMRPVLKDRHKIDYCTGFDDGQKKEIEQLEDYFKDSCSIYEICTYTNRSTLDLSMLLQPAIAVGAIKVLPFEKLEKQDRPLIACIDDSQAIQRIVKMTLQAGGFDVMSITEPAKAMSTFVRQKPDLILMDINMPEIDGYKLAYMLRQSSLLKDIPIMMLTGRDGVLDRVKAKMVGAVGYICKPFNPQELVQSVHDNVQK